MHYTAITSSSDAERVIWSRLGVKASKLSTKLFVPAAIYSQMGGGYSSGIGVETANSRPNILLNLLYFIKNKEEIAKPRGETLTLAVCSVFYSSHQRFDGLQRPELTSMA